MYAMKKILTAIMACGAMFAAMPLVAETQVVDGIEWRYAVSNGTAANLAACKFTRKGYAFAGWATSAANAKAGKVKYKNKQAVKNLVITGKTVKFYAVWKK